MGKIWMSGGGGGGLDPDDLTATPAQVLAGYKAGVKGLDEPAAGTMVNQGAKTAALNAGGSYTIPAGYHNGVGKVTANALSGQTAGTAVAANIRNGKTAWANGAKITGNMPEQGGSTTTPGTANKTIVAANRYVTGNIIVAGDKNLIPANVKKNVTLFGVKGTHEGWVPVATDLYYNGVNTAGFTISSGCTFENTRIKLPVNKGIITSPKAHNVQSYSKLNLKGAFGSNGNVDNFYAQLQNDDKVIANYATEDGKVVKFTEFSFDITQIISLSANWYIQFYTNRHEDAHISRIWFC